MRNMGKNVDRILAQSQMIPLRLIPVDREEDHDSPGTMYLFALAFCQYCYGVADGTIDGSDWGLAYYNENANGFDANLARYLQYARNLSRQGD